MNKTVCGDTTRRTDVMANSTRSNSTDDEGMEHGPPGFQLTMDMGYILMAVVIIFLNTTVFVLMKIRRSLHTTSNYFLLSLAASDLITGLYTIPVFIACKATFRNDLCQASVPVFTFTSISILSHIAVITLDKYIYIIYSLRYASLVTGERGRLVILLIWALSLLVALIQLVWNTPGEVEVTEEGTDDWKKKEHAFSISLLLLHIIPFPFLAFAYIRIFVQIRRQHNFIRSNIGPGNRATNTHELRTVTVFILMLCAYLFCWLPNAIVRFQYSTDWFELPIWAEILIVHLRFLTSLLNPLFYVFGKKDFRGAIRCCWLRRVSSGALDSSSNQRSPLPGVVHLQVRTGDSSFVEYSSRSASFNLSV
ncbi:adenosine receptor A2b-like isoform X2 [Nematostella vectensis]|uniref:adenosine receptor A2b-like isoform X2 n=1 Tax=Nematostella vectensis TaxID=45351 RepID=UPI00207770C4|nr:adenosine receptor A2b-like isoform X2 [Nematostella vectensis]XP_048585807.1 adenosine receptor A2b-like isoform X2 [Nematostella vectensis]